MEELENVEHLKPVYEELRKATARAGGGVMHQVHRSWSRDGLSRGVVNPSTGARVSSLHRATATAGLAHMRGRKCPAERGGSIERSGAADTMVLINSPDSVRFRTYTVARIFRSNI
jgi:hypothetical protein